MFNRLLRKSKSLISKVSGTTRDRRYGLYDVNDYQALLVDTGGLLGDEGEMAENINEQGIIAIDEADIILFLTNLVDGLHPQDKLLARLLRNTSKPVIVCVNKCDHEKLNTAESIRVFERLGFGQPIPISASHGRGINDLADKVSLQIEKLGFEKHIEDESSIDQEQKKDIRIAIVGVPNVGKSSLLNEIIGSQRAVVSDIPGTTTDPVDSHILWREKYPITLVDTAGIRKKKSQEGDVEKLSSLWSLKVIENSHLVVLVIDASKGPQLQDIKLSGYIIENYKSCIIVINKWDLAKERGTKKEQYEDYIRKYLKFWDYIPIVFTSAKDGLNVNDILDYAVRIMEERNTKISTNKLFNLIQESLITHPPPSKGKKKLKIRFMTQANMYGSPTFVFFVNYPELAEGGFSRYLENTIRSYHPFTGTPIRILIRKSETNTKKSK